MNNKYRRFFADEVARHNCHPPLRPLELSPKWWASSFPINDIDQLVTISDYFNQLSILKLTSIRVPDSVEVDHDTVTLKYDSDGYDQLSICRNEQFLSIRQFLRISINIAAAIFQLHSKSIALMVWSIDSILVNWATDEIQFVNLVFMKKCADLGVPYRADLAIFSVVLDLLVAAVCRSGEYIPPIILDMIQALKMAKSDWGYRNIASVKSDLMRCLAGLDRDYSVPYFYLSHRTGPSKIEFPTHMIGNARNLTDFVSRASAISRSNRIWIDISGDSGVGKTRFVSAGLDLLHLPVPILYSNGNPKNQHDPYDCIRQWVNSWVQTVIVGGKLLLQQMADLLHFTFLDYDATPLVQLFPELTVIWTPLSSGVPMDHVFLVRYLIQTIIETQKTWVVWMDNVHWMDTQSESIISQLKIGETTAILVITSHIQSDRLSLASVNNSVFFDQFLVARILLNPLGVADIGEVVRFILGNNFHSVDHFSELLFEKTGGNFASIKEFIFRIYRLKLVWLQSDSPQWLVDMNRVRLQECTGNVANRCIAEFDNFSEFAKTVLKTASAIGFTFDLHEISTILTVNSLTIVPYLNEAIRHGIITPLLYPDPVPAALSVSDGRMTCSYQFTHHRIAQAIYQTIPIHDRSRLHYEIGIALAAHLQFKYSFPSCILISRQFNLGKSHIFNDYYNEIRNRSNWYAAQYYLQNDDCINARHFYEAIASSWIDQTDLSFPETVLQIRLEMIRCYTRLRNFNAAVLILSILNQGNYSLDDRIKIRIAEIKLLTQALNFDQALIVGNRILGELGIEIRHQWVHQLWNRLRLLWISVSFSKRNQFTSVNGEKTGRQIVISTIISEMGLAAYGNNQEFALSLVLDAYHQRHYIKGYAEFAYGLAGTGIALGVFNRLDISGQLGRVAIHLLKNNPPNRIRTKVLELVASMIIPWTESLPNALPLFEAAYQSSLETMDWEYGGISVNNWMGVAFMLGEPLEAVKLIGDQFSGVIRQESHPLVTAFISIKHASIQALSMPTGFELQSGSGNHWVDPNLIGIPVIAFNYHFYRLFLSVIMGNSEMAYIASIHANRVKKSVRGLYYYGDFVCIQSLALGNHMTYLSGVNRLKSWVRIGVNLIRMMIWSASSPENFEHKVYLVRGILMQTLGDYSQAIQNYHRAIQSIPHQQFRHYEAVTWEKLSECYALSQNDRMAEHCFLRAKNCYLTWGALAKVDQMNRQHP